MKKAIDGKFLDNFRATTTIIINQANQEDYKNKIFSLITTMCDEFESLVLNSSTFCSNFINTFGENNSDDSRKIHLSNLLFLEKRIFNLKEEFLQIERLDVIQQSEEKEKLSKILSDFKALERITENKAKEVEILIEMDKQNGVINEKIYNNYDLLTKEIRALENENKKLMSKQKEYFYILLVLIVFVGILSTISFVLK